jgi:hypothetical protein
VTYTRPPPSPTCILYYVTLVISPPATVSYTSKVFPEYVGGVSTIRDYLDYLSHPCLIFEGMARGYFIEEGE